MLIISGGGSAIPGRGKTLTLNTQQKESWKQCGVFMRGAGAVWLERGEEEIWGHVAEGSAKEGAKTWRSSGDLRKVLK